MRQMGKNQQALSHFVVRFWLIFSIVAKDGKFWPYASHHRSPEFIFPFGRTFSAPPKQCNLVPRASRLPSLFLAIILY